MSIKKFFALQKFRSDVCGRVKAPRVGGTRREGVCVWGGGGG